jgi:phosphomannomutase
MSDGGLMIGVSGVRGRVGDGLTPEVIAGYAAAFGAWASASARAAPSRRSGHTERTAGAASAIVVGRDSRVSGPMFHRVVLSALQSVGCDVIDLGVVPTPTIQLAVEHHHAAGGLAITASHNPVEWNALKFISPTGLFLDASEGAAMRAVLQNGIPRAAWNALGVISFDERAVERHIQAVLDLPYVDVERIRARRFRVGLDCVHGAGSVIMPLLLDRLGCEVVATGLQADGRFPRPPEPVPENLGTLERLVLSTGSDVGLAVDPDVDRLALVSDEGRAIGEDFTLALAARLVLRRKPGIVVTNLSTSRILEDVAAETGSTIIRAPVGEVNVAVRMRQERAQIGGEGNGGVILAALHLGRDAPAGAALVLQLLAEEGRPLSAVVRDLPHYAIVKDKLDRPAGDIRAVYAGLIGAFPGADADTQDGLRLSWPDRWLHVRPSGTEPIVRVIAEAPTEAQARELITAARAPLELMNR